MKLTNYLLLLLLVVSIQPAFSKGEKPNVFNKRDIAIPYRNPTDKRIKKLIENGSNGKTPFDVFHFNL